MGAVAAALEVVVVARKCYAQDRRSPRIPTYTHTHTNTHTYIYIYIYIHIYTYICICIHTCIYM